MLLTSKMLADSGYTLRQLESQYAYDSACCQEFQQGYSHIDPLYDTPGSLGRLSHGSLRWFIAQAKTDSWRKALKELEECRRRLVANGFGCAYTCCQLPYTGSLEWPPKEQFVTADLVVFAPPRLMLRGFTQSPFIISGRLPGYECFDEAEMMYEAHRLSFSVIPRYDAPYWVDDWMLSEHELEDEYVAPQAVFILKHRGRGWHGPGGCVDPNVKFRKATPTLCHELKIGHAVLHYDNNNPSNHNRVGLYMGNHKVYSPDWYNPEIANRVGAANHYDLGSKTGHR